MLRKSELAPLATVAAAAAIGYLQRLSADPLSLGDFDVGTGKLILSEIRYRPLGFCLALLAVVAAAALFVAGPALVLSYAADTDARLTAMEEETKKELDVLDKRTKRIMRDLGVNLRIVHQDTNMTSLYTDFHAVDFPETYVERLANAEGIDKIVHLVATLQQKIKWNNRTVLLVGMLPVMTNSQKNEEKPHMVKPVAEGTVLVGHDLAGFGTEQRLKAGDTLEIEGRTFKVAQVMPEMGTIEDAQLVLHLRDAQEVTGLSGRIHQIMALNCKCAGNRISAVRAELENVLPDTKVTEHLSRATAREEQRDLVAKTRKTQLEAERTRRAESAGTLGRITTLSVPLALLLSTIVVGALAWLNVRERRFEIGVYRALGKGGGKIAALFLGKAVLLGLLGGVLGCVAGYAIVAYVGQSALNIEHQQFPAWLVVATVLGGPLIAAIASYLPTLLAIRQDPAIVLSDP